MDGSFHAQHKHEHVHLLQQQFNIQFNIHKLQVH